jgi:hypothetical protein
MLTRVYKIPCCIIPGIPKASLFVLQLLGHPSTWLECKKSGFVAWRRTRKEEDKSVF